MQSMLPKEGNISLDEELAADLLDMWSEKHDLSEHTKANLRRQLTTLQYDAETIRTWKGQLTQWKG